MFFIPPGTVISISRAGAEFKKHTTSSVLEFNSPVLETDDEMIFARDNWRVLVKRKKVISSDYHRPADRADKTLGDAEDKKKGVS